MATTNEEGAIWIAAANHWTGREGQRPRFVIVHGTAGGTSAEGTGNYFADPNRQASAHYVVGRDGAIIQCVREEDAAWSNGGITGPAGTGGDGVHHDSWWDNGGINPNLLSIAVEHVKPHDDNSDQLTAPQCASSFALIKHICQRWSIPMRPATTLGGITGHFSMDPVNRSRCPGPYPWDQLWLYLKGDTAMAGVPRGWKDDGKVLTAPNGVPVKDGFRDYILSHDWDADNTPEQPEQGMQQLELSNPGLGGGTWLSCKKYDLEWTRDRGVFPAYTGRELLVTRKQFYNVVTQLNAARTQLQTTQAQILQLQQKLLAAQDSTPLVTELKDTLSQIHDLSDVKETFVK